MYSQLLKNTQLDSNKKCDILFIIDAFLVDESSEMRDLAADCLSEMEIVNTKLDSLLIRMELLDYCLDEFGKENDYLQEKLISVVINQHFKEIIKFELNSFGLLFPPEAQNPRYEPCFYIQRVGTILSRMNLSPRIQNQIEIYCKEYQEEFSKIKNLFFWKHKAPLFTLYTQFQVMQDLIL